ncbi:DUF4330 domain-containing protein [Haloarcula laminariae]|uniref:DUF4330 domain-containing protein n=1 Tax=Haloarcula laminariae TaxID=2961577 RepID=UPI0021C95BEE|nr:DUF4330 domain-containing protein [Halomicroarcula laminariae]
MDPHESLDRLIDEEGTFLGVVNVFDALVILIVIVAGIAGVALMSDQVGTPPESATVHVTLNLDTQPTYIAAAINEGDSYSPTENSNLTVTGVRVAPADTGTHVVVGAELSGVTRNDQFRYEDDPIRLGQEITIRTQTYKATGNVTEFSREPTLGANRTTVVVRERMVPREAEEIATGDEIAVAGRTIGSVSAVAVYPTNNASERVVLVESELPTHMQRDDRYFGDMQVSRGQNLRFSTTTTVIDGRIERVGTGLDRASRTNRTVRLVATGVSEETAAVVRPGLTERTNGRTTAYVTDIAITPSQVVATTANGTVITGDHPTRRDLTLTTELQVSETATGPRFRGERLQHGSTVVLDLETVTVETTVVGLSE